MMHEGTRIEKLSCGGGELAGIFGSGNKFAVSGFDEKMQFIEWSRHPCSRARVDTKRQLFRLNSRQSVN